MTISFPDPAQHNPPRSIAGMFNRAMANLRTGKYAEALDNLNRVIERDPKNSTAWYYRGLVHGLLGDNESSLFDFDKSLEIMPRYVDAMRMRAMLLNQMGRFAEAAEAAEATLKLAPENVDARHTLTIARSMLNDPAGALAELELIMKEDGRKPVLLNNRAALLNDLERYDEAFKDVDLAIEMQSGVSAFHATRAESRRGLKDYQGALIDHNIAIKLQPDYAKLYEERAKTYDALEDPVNADLDRREAQQLRAEKPDAQRPLEIVPPKPRPQRPKLLRFLPVLILLALLVLSNLSNTRNNPNQRTDQQRIQTYTQRITQNPNDIDSLLQRGNLYFDNDRYSEAARDFDKVIALDPQEWRGYVGRGLVYANFGDTDKAVEYFKKALAINPGFDREGQFAEFIKLYEKK